MLPRLSTSLRKDFFANESCDENELLLSTYQETLARSLILAAGSHIQTRFYLVGIPLSAYLGLSLRWGVIGIWGGIGVSFIIQVACYAFILIRLDWNAAAVEAAARTNEGCEESEAGNGRSSGDSRLAISQQYK